MTTTTPHQPASAANGATAVPAFPADLIAAPFDQAAGPDPDPDPAPARTPDAAVASIYRLNALGRLSARQADLRAAQAERDRVHAEFEDLLAVALRVVFGNWRGAETSPEATREAVMAWTYYGEQYDRVMPFHDAAVDQALARVRSAERAVPPAVGAAC